MQELFQIVIMEVYIKLRTGTWVTWFAILRILEQYKRCKKLLGTSIERFCTCKFKYFFFKKEKSLEPREGEIGL